MSVLSPSGVDRVRSFYAAPSRPSLADQLREREAQVGEAITGALSPADVPFDLQLSIGLKVLEVDVTPRENAAGILRTLAQALLNSANRLDSTPPAAVAVGA
jgi:hypothetical protein